MLPHQSAASRRKEKLSLSYRSMRRLHYAILLLLCSIGACGGWEWSDLLQVGTPQLSSSSTLTLGQVSEMRVRDIKRRLARNHGYGADEIARMLDKKELINALAYEEHKLRQLEQAKLKRELTKISIIVTVLAGALVLFWPLLKHVWEVAHVNFVVYTDRKKLEAVRCWELRSYQGCFGVAIMFLLDTLQIWLTGSVILSWVMTSKYFFPIPSLSIRPAAMMGGPMSTGSLAQYGINIGPMVVTWALRFLQRRVESWTGKAMSRAQQAQRKEERAKETAEEKAARRARRAARRAAREEAQQAQNPEWMPDRQPTTPPLDENGGPDAIDETKEYISREQLRDAAAAAAERRQRDAPPVEIFSKLDELD